MPDVARTVLNITGGLVAFGLIGILGFMTYALVYVKIPQDNNNALTILIGVLAANVGTVVGFYYGSSIASKKQADTISVLAETAKTAQVSLSAVSPQPGPTVELKAGDVATVKAEDA